MRELYHKELDRLDQDVVRLGAIVESALERAALALLEGDAELARQVMEGDDQIDNLFLDIEKRALSIMAKQAPVARDLRLIVAILRSTHDLERAGDLAYNVAKVAAKQIPVAQIRSVRSILHELSAAALELFRKAIDCWATKDVSLAASLEGADDTIDQLYKQLYRELFALEKDEATFEVAMNAALVGRWFERIGDHGVNVADDVRFYVTGHEEFLG